MYKILGAKSWSLCISSGPIRRCKNINYRRARVLYRCRQARTHSHRRRFIGFPMIRHIIRQRIVWIWCWQECLYWMERAMRGFLRPAVSHQPGYSATRCESVTLATIYLSKYPNIFVPAYQYLDDTSSSKSALLEGPWDSPRAKTTPIWIRRLSVDQTRNGQQHHLRTLIWGWLRTRNHDLKVPQIVFIRRCTDPSHCRFQSQGILTNFSFYMVRTRIC